MAQSANQENSPVLHVVVIGFHHKKGCQVEYSYPPLIEGNPVDSHEVPEEWKHLPSLGLPDGSHNFTKDTIFFHLPSRDKLCKTVYGVACYRQMNASDLVNRTSDVTRSTVQKSVCVLSRLPLYGLIKAKLELITHAYFDEKDFSKVELLEDTYKNLCIGLTDSLRDGSQVFLGLSVRDVVMQFRHKIVLLFKLILLERRVLFFGAPVEELCSTILSVLSLFPGMIEFGLEEAASCGLNKQISPTLYSKKFDSEHEEFLEIRYHDEMEKTTQSVPGVNRSKTDASVALSGNTQVQHSVDEEPLSPTISRGCELDASFNRSYNNENHHSSIELPGSHRNESGHSDGKNEHQHNTELPSVHRNESGHRDGENEHHHNTELPGVHRNESGHSDSKNEHHHNTELPGVHRNESGHSDSSKHSKNLSNEFLKHSTVAKGDNSSNYTKHPKKDLKVKLTSDDDSKSKGEEEIDDKREITHNESANKKSPTVVTGSNPNSPVIITNDESPLSNVNFVTLEAVQTGKTISPKDSVINIEEYSEKFENDMSLDDSGNETSKLELSLNLEDGLLQRSDSIEELDSPESILKIDREDCFSWEEDRLLLTIKDDTDSRENSDEHVLENARSHDMVETDLKGESTNRQISDNVNMHSNGNSESTEIKKDVLTGTDGFDSKEATSDKSLKTSPSIKASVLKNRLSSAFGGWNVREKVRVKRQSKSSTPSPTSELPVTTIETVKAISVIQQDDCGLPLLIFTKGCICFPYLSLQYYDLMENVNVRGFVVGATNILFKQKRHLTDVVIDVNDGKIDFHDRELQKQLNLTTEDLRFADILVKAVIDDKDDIYLDGTEWEGGDEWLRAQFKLYLQSLMATMYTNDAKLIEDFGTSFVQSWKTTHNYRIWSNKDHTGIKDLLTGHPCQGNLGVADIKMRLSHNLSSTERGKKINAAVVQTGKYVEQAGKAVGGALTQARSSISSWFSSFTQEWKKDDKQ